MNVCLTGGSPASCGFPVAATAPRNPPRSELRVLRRGYFFFVFFLTHSPIFKNYILIAIQFFDYDLSSMFNVFRSRTRRRLLRDCRSQNRSLRGHRLPRPPTLQLPRRPEIPDTSTEMSTLRPPLTDPRPLTPLTSTT